MPPLQDAQYSTLEVHHTRWLENDGGVAPIFGRDPKQEKMVAHNDGKIVSVSNGKMVIENDVGKEAIAIDEPIIQPEQLLPIQERRYFGLRRRTFFILLIMALFLASAAIVGAAVGGIIATHKRRRIARIPANPSSSSRTHYGNIGLAAMQWTDLNGTLHKRLYYQDSSNKLRESAWDNGTDFKTAWRVNVISKAVKPGTPIAAQSGYPHASYNYTLVKNVYYLSTDNGLSAIQAPSNNSQAWKDDNFSGLYTGCNSTYLTAYWNQNFQNVSQELVVLFQEENFPNGITQARYISNKTTSNPWVTNKFGFSHPKGDTFAMSLVSYRSGKHLMLYTVDNGNALKQHEYRISDIDPDPETVVSLLSESATGITIQPQSPLAVVSQDNQPLFTVHTLPECAQDKPLTNLILFTVPDRSSLVLRAWNCSTGFSDLTSEIKPLQKANTTYLSLAALNDKSSGDGNMYIMFDSGKGPQVEEWTMPKRAGEPWITSRNVTVDFDLSALN